MTNKLKNLSKCCHIACNAQYIAGFGSGVTVFRRKDFSAVCHFSGMRYISGGEFLDEDTIFVATAENRFFFLSVSRQQIIWAPERPRMLDTSGDPVFLVNRQSGEVCVIAQGRLFLNQHFFLVLNPNRQTVSAAEIPNCLRVIVNSIQMDGDGYSFLHYEASGNGKINYRITRTDRSISDFETLFSGEGDTAPCYWGNQKLFFSSPGNPFPRMSYYDLNSNQETSLHLPEELSKIPPAKNPWTWEPLPVPPPRISGLSPNGKYLYAYTDKLFMRLDLERNGNAELRSGEAVQCGIKVDDWYLVGGSTGLFMHSIN